MRITNQMMINNTMANIQVNKNQLSTIDNQLSTQKKISKPSEDPIVAIRALRLRSSLEQVTQYLDKNIPDASSWLDVTEGALNEANSIITNLYQYCNQGSTDSYSTAERDTIATSLNKLKEAFYSQGDVDYAGRYVFSGFQTDKPLTYQSNADAENVNYTITQNFTRDNIENKTIYTNAYSNDDIVNLNVTKDGDGNYVTPNVADVYRIRTGYTTVKDTGYQMNYNDTDIKVNDDGTQATVTTYELDASGAVKKDADNNPIVKATTTVALGADKKFEVTDSHGNAVKIGTTTDANCAPAANEIMFNATTGEVLLGTDTHKTIYNTNSFSLTYNKDNFIKGDLDPTMYYNCIDNNTGIAYKKESSAIEYNINFSQKLKVNTEASDAFDIYLGRDIDDLVNSVQNVIDVESQIDKVKSMQGLDQYKDDASQEKLSAMLEGLNKQHDLAKDQMTKAFESGVSKMQSHQQTVTLAKADVGNRQTRLDLTKSRLTDQKTNFTTLKSQNEDVDLEEVVVNYTSAELVYNASLTAASKAVQQTLLDFLR